jgi:hypothetical protein
MYAKVINWFVRVPAGEGGEALIGLALRAGILAPRRLNRVF